MHAICSRRQEVHSIPAHLQQHKSNNQQQIPPHGTLPATAHPEMQVAQICTPCCSRPCLLRVPAPICAPGLLCPQAAAHHSEREEGNAYGHKTICGWQECGRTPPQPGKSQQERTAEKTVREHVYRDMRYEPCALQGRHERSVVNVRTQYINCREHHHHD